MKAKKMMALLLTAAMGMSALTGCGGGNGKESGRKKERIKGKECSYRTSEPSVSATYQDR